jgi:hypothetical protein
MRLASFRQTFVAESRYYRENLQAVNDQSCNNQTNKGAFFVTTYGRLPCAELLSLQLGVTVGFLAIHPS